jgi:asparagine synthase (glutamine-hydrolysing)
MCGIVGFLDPSGSRDADLPGLLTKMSDCLSHRGPDDAGIWIDERLGLGLGHRRLSILDLSPSGHQPMSSHSGRFVLSFNGEIYNYLDIRRELESVASPIRWRGHSDTEVMLEAVERWGVRGSLERMTGMFALALWDRAESTLHIARDRLGEKPLYYGWLDRAFVFASELKALHTHPRWKGEIDRGALSLFLRHTFVPAPYSIYKGIHKLTPGTVLSVRPDGSSTEVAYWSARDVAERGDADPFVGTEIEAADMLESLLSRAVGRQMVADVPLGAFLSGGVDSSTVVALMQAQSERPVKTFTIGFREAGHNEAEHAKAVARHLGTEHTELYVTPAEAMNVIPRLPTLYDEPFSDASQIPTFLVAQLARRKVTVSLSGDGGDELFGGYYRYFVGRRLWHNLGWMPAALRRLAAAGLVAIPPGLVAGLMAVSSNKARIANLGERLHKLGALLAAASPEEMDRGLISQWNDPAEVVLAGAEPITAATDPRQWAKLSDFTQRMMFLDLVTWLPDDILVKVDRAAMGVSLETRVPMLDHAVVEFAWRLPLSYKIRGGEGKWLLRQVLFRHVPRELIDRPKSGFDVPIGSWIGGPLRDWAESLLNEDRLRREGYFNPAIIRDRWSQHLAGRRDWQQALWGVLMFQSWLESQGQTGVLAPDRTTPLAVSAAV